MMNILSVSYHLNDRLSILFCGFFSKNNLRFSEEKNCHDPWIDRKGGDWRGAGAVPERTEKYRF
jgi:hypothetical protein